FSCHSHRVYAVEVEPGNPFVFWSASEDGTVRYGTVLAFGR
ncbi:unnamed protein product, partial [Hapterophycus canaliculatus]